MPTSTTLELAAQAPSAAGVRWHPAASSRVVGITRRVGTAQAHLESSPVPVGERGLARFPRKEATTPRRYPLIGRSFVARRFERSRGGTTAR